ncbi:MAG: hypothetical protein WBW92_02540 [Rhodanobacteraceae bacterium]
MDLGCTDMSVAGSLQVDSATISAVHNVAIQAGGTLDGGSGSITMAGNWSDGGTFIPSTSSVFFVDNSACAPSSALSGNTSFYNLSLISILGKVYTLTPGNTQAILNGLTIQGTPANPIQITSGNPGSPGFVNLASGGTQNISHVGVSDNWATGQALAPLLTNEGGTGNSRGWFGIALQIPIPALGTGGIGLLALFLAGFGILFAASRTRSYERK